MLFNKVLQKALDKGITVIASNTDALLGTGDPLEHKIPYIGSSLFSGGHELARKAVEYFPDPSKIHALVGVARHQPGHEHHAIPCFSLPEEAPRDEPSLVPGRQQTAPGRQWRSRRRLMQRASHVADRSA
jgi:hypothetical protein